MKKNKIVKLCIFILLTFFFLHTQVSTHAVYNPLSRPNNKIGIHILTINEINQAADLINSSGGDWGYVTIPIQAYDKDLVKWQEFMNTAKELHLIPIIRLATNGDYFNTAVWEKPDYTYILDFANFLDSLDWPTQNRYVIIYNEVNRGDEWGGAPNPSEYANLLAYAVTAFKSKSQNFFVISAGLDNAADNVPNKSINEYTFMQQMNIAVPGIFNQIDGLSSHSYPNPGFAQPPSVLNQKSINSFAFEKQLAESMSNKKLPVFITETGWSSDKISDNIIGDYYTQSLNSVWNNNSIVTVAPFLLKAGGGPFAQFSLLNPDGQPNMRYKAIKNFPKVKGQPEITANKVLGDEIKKIDLPVKHFEYKEDKSSSEVKTTAAKVFLKWLLNVR